MPLSKGSPEEVAVIGRSIVGHDALDADSVGAIVRDDTLKTLGDGSFLLVLGHADPGQARGVVDGDVDILPADAAGAMAANAGDAVAG